MLVASRANARPSETPSDPAVARDLLKQGYELARASRCDEAVPLLARSADLDPQPKTYLNLARCEEAASRFGDALGHWVLARDLARDQGLRGVRAEAEARLVALELRMPYVTLTLLTAHAGEVVVRKDGARVPPEALGRPLPVDPGEHVFVIEAEGRVTRSVTVEIAEGQRAEVSVDPGEPASPAARPPPPPSPPTSVASPPAGEHAVHSSPARPRNTTTSPASLLMWSGVGLASVGLVTGAVTGLMTLSKSGLRDECPKRQCPPEVMAEVEQARTTGTISTVAFTTAAVGAAAAGVGLYLKLRVKEHARAADVALSPTLGGVDARITF